MEKLYLGTSSYHPNLGHHHLPFISLIQPRLNAFRTCIHSLDLHISLLRFTPNHHPHSLVDPLYPRLLPHPPSAPVLYFHVGHYPGCTAIGITASHVVFDSVSIGLVLREWEEALRDITAYKANGVDKSDLGHVHG